MADERFVAKKVECQHCKTSQKVHVLALGFGHRGSQTISCIKCEKTFDVMADKIIGGPFPWVERPVRPIRR